MGDLNVSGSYSSRAQACLPEREAPPPPVANSATAASSTPASPNGANRTASPANPGVGPAITVDRAQTSANSRLFSPTRAPTPVPAAPTQNHHEPAGVHNAFTHSATSSTQDWARTYREGEERGGVTGRLQQAGAAVMGSLSVLATPEHITHTAMTLGGAALGAVAGMAGRALAARAAVPVVETGIQQYVLAARLNQAAHAAHTVEELTHVAHLAEAGDSMNNRLRGTSEH